MNRLAVTVPEAAEMLGGVHPNTIWSMLRRGELERKKVGSRTVIPLTSIHSFLNGEGPADGEAQPDESDLRSDD